MASTQALSLSLTPKAAAGIGLMKPEASPCSTIGPPSAPGTVV